VSKRMAERRFVALEALRSAPIDLYASRIRPVRRFSNLRREKPSRKGVAEVEWLRKPDAKNVVPGDLEATLEAHRDANRAAVIRKVEVWPYRGNVPYNVTVAMRCAAALARKALVEFSSTTAEETIPKETIPKETIPKETIPKETIPKETIPKETTLKETSTGKADGLSDVVSFDGMNRPPKLKIIYSRAKPEDLRDKDAATNARADPTFRHGNDGNNAVGVEHGHYGHWAQTSTSGVFLHQGPWYGRIDESSVRGSGMAR